MDLEQIKTSIATWAATEPLVTRAYIFGSRLKGTHRVDSDLDVAIEMKRSPGDETVRATWICEANRMKESIKSFVPYVVDLQHYNGEETPHIHTYLNEASTVIYDSCDESNREQD